MSLRATPPCLALSFAFLLLAGCTTPMPREEAFAPMVPPAGMTADAKADPAVWGVYARLVGHSFRPPQSGFPGYAVSWSKPGQEIRESIRYLDGNPFGDDERVARLIRPGPQPGTLISLANGTQWLGTLETDGSVLFKRDDGAAPYRVRLSPAGEYLAQTVSLGTDGRLQDVTISVPYSLVGGVPAPVATAATSSPNPATSAQASAPALSPSAAPAASPSSMMLATQATTASVTAAASLAVPEAAKAGDVEAQYQFGRRLENGDAVPKNEAEAAIWYRKAAEQGHAGAQTALGTLYSGGKGVEMDLPTAAAWLRKAADQGNNEAQNRYAVMLDEGKGVPRDDSAAVAWYRKAALQGNQDAQNNLGMMYEHGEGVAQDKAEAEVWYRKAAASGNSRAKANLAGLMAEQEATYEEDDAPAVPSGGQIFMNALTTFNQEYGKAMAQQAASQAMIQETYARARAEQEWREEANERRRAAEARIEHEEAEAARERQVVAQHAQLTETGGKAEVIEAKEAKAQTHVKAEATMAKQEAERASKAEAVRLEAEKRKRERETQLAAEKAQREAAEQAARAARQQEIDNYLAGMTRGTQLAAMRCAGQTVLVGRLAGLKRPSSLSTVCFDYRYRCQGSNYSSSGHAYNMAGLGPHCTSDTIDIEPACPADQVVAEVTRFVVCK